MRVCVLFSFLAFETSKNSFFHEKKKESEKSSAWVFFSRGYLSIETQRSLER